VYGGECEWQDSAVSIHLLLIALFADKPPDISICLEPLICIEFCRPQHSVNIVSMDILCNFSTIQDYEADGNGGGGQGAEYGGEGAEIPSNRLGLPVSLQIRLFLTTMPAADVRCTWEICHGKLLGKI
jgi:hypothetical protein